MDGLHILANFYQCSFNFEKEIELLAITKKLCEEVGLTVVGISYHEFEPQGLTFAILLAESHVSIHTWPETGNVAFDIYTCNYHSNNEEKTRLVYEKLKTILQPSSEDTKFIQRDSLT